MTTAMTDKEGHMETPQTALSPGRTNLALATLFLGTFVLGSANFKPEE